MSFGDAMRKLGDSMLETAGVFAVVSSLMEMSESEGLEHLKIAVPKVVEMELMPDLIEQLRRYTRSDDMATGVKAFDYLRRARSIAENCGWSG